MPQCQGPGVVHTDCVTATQERSEYLLLKRFVGEVNKHTSPSQVPQGLPSFPNEQEHKDV